MNLNPYQSPLFADLELRLETKGQFSLPWLLWKVFYTLSIVCLYALILVYEYLWPDIPPLIVTLVPLTIAIVGLGTLITIFCGVKHD